MKNWLGGILIVITGLFWGEALECSAGPITAKLFAGSDGKLNKQQAALYVIYRDKVPLSKVMNPGKTTLDLNAAADALADDLDDLRSKTGHEAPWTWQELDRGFPPKSDGGGANTNVPAWKNIEGITKKKEFANTNALENIGPFMLRNSIADLTKSLTDAKGATLAYSRNGLKNGSGALNSQGVLDYPTKWNLFQGGRGRSVEMGLDLASEWNVAQVQEDRTKDVEALTFSTPVTFYISPGNWLGNAGTGNTPINTKDASSSLWLTQAKPYYETDFSFGHEIYGVQATEEYVGSLFGSRYLYLGGYQNLWQSGLQYQLRLIPQLDYSVTERGGIYTTRKVGDDWFRLGGTGSLDFRLGLQTFNALDAGISYQFLETVSGSRGYSHLFKAHTTLWLIENVGMTFEYSKGNTPVAVKPIDLITLGLEFKY